MTTKTKKSANTAAKKTAATKPAAKKTVAKKAVAKKPAEKKTAGTKPAVSAKVRAAAAPAVAPSPATGDDGRWPDAPVATLVKHAGDLAGVVRSLAEELAGAKVSTDDADRLDALSAKLQSAEDTWNAARRAVATGSVAQLRPVLTAGRNDLFGALEAFVDDDAVTRELEDIGGVDDDDDLERDTRRLLKLCATYADDLEGTEITPEAVAAVETTLGRFRDARRGAPIEAEGETKQALSEAAQKALDARNRLFFELSDLDRRVCLRGRFCFRKDPARRARFSGYLSEARRGRKPSAPRKPAAPVTG